jgi:hypothetical protein
MAERKARRRAANPKPFIISFRVNAQEWETLRRQTEENGTSVSELLRASLHRLLRDKQLFL